jgi:hypothetical protein
MIKTRYTIKDGDFTACGTVFNADHIRAVSYIDIINKNKIFINLFGFFSEIKNNHTISIFGIGRSLPEVKQVLAVRCFDKNLKSQLNIVKCFINQDGEIKIEHLKKNKSAQYYQISGCLNIVNYPCWVEYD